MAKLYNLARMTTTTTGSDVITLGTAVAGRLDFETAGVLDGETISYGIVEGNSSEVGRGVYGGSGSTLTRSVLNSTNGGSPIVLVGSGHVFISSLAEDLEINQTGGIVQIELYNETLAESGNFDFTSIPQTYDHLLIRITSQSSVSANDDGFDMLINGDSTATNYKRKRIQDASAAHALSLQIGVCSADSGSSDDFTPLEIFIPNYSGGQTKFYYSRGLWIIGTGDVWYLQYAIRWNSTAAITRITYQPDGYATDKFITGSFCQIIGIKTVS